MLGGNDFELDFSHRQLGLGSVVTVRDGSTSASSNGNGSSGIRRTGRGGSMSASSVGSGSGGIRRIGRGGSTSTGGLGSGGSGIKSFGGNIKGASTSRRRCYWLRSCRFSSGRCCFGSGQPENYVSIVRKRQKKRKSHAPRSSHQHSLIGGGRDDVSGNTAEDLKYLCLATSGCLSVIRKRSWLPSKTIHRAAKVGCKDGRSWPALAFLKATMALSYENGDDRRGA